jgi:hypothetical protein
MADTRSSQPSLTVLGGPLSGTRFVLEESVDEILVGSDPSCRFHIPSPGVSPLHARLWVDAEGVAVYDTNSPRGVYVNDDRIQGRATLRNGDILWLGPPGDPEGVMLQCRIPARPAAAAPAPATAPAPVPPVEAAPIEEEGIVIAPAAVEQAPLFEIVPEAGAVIAVPEPVPAPDETIAYTPADAFDAETVVQPRYEEETTRFTPGPAAVPPATVPEPAYFEEDIEETVADIPSPAPASTPAPPPATEGETFVMAAPEEEFDATTPLDLSEPPPPPPPPAPKAAQAQRPAAHPEAPRRAPAPRPAAQPRPAAPPPVPAPAGPTGAPARGKAGVPALVLGGMAAALVVLAGAGYVAYVMFLRPAAPAPPATAAPTTVAAAPAPTAEPPAAPSPEPPVATATTPTLPTPAPVAATPTPPPGAPTPSPSPKATPSPSPSPKKGATPTPPPAPATPNPDQLRAQQQAQQVAALTQQGDSALAARQYDVAIGHLDQVLRLEPGNAHAAEARTRAVAARDAAKKSFVSGRTNVQAAKSEKGGVSGFDTDDVSVAKAPDFTGRLEFEISPASLKPGDAYVLKVYLVNDGKRSIKVTGVNITRTVNGTASGQPVAPSAREAQPRQRVLLAELPGAWPETVTSWSTEVVMTANKGDSLTNRLAWR